MHRNDETSGRGRREFLKNGAGFGFIALSAPFVLSACGKGGDDGPNCQNPPGLSPAERQQRTALVYVEKAADESRRCDVCAFYTLPPSEGQCGGCTLGLGPVNPAGSCNSFAPKT